MIYTRPLLSPEPMILLVSTKVRDLWLAPTPEAHDSQNGKSDWLNTTGVLGSCSKNRVTPEVSLLGGLVLTKRLRPLEMKMTLVMSEIVLLRALLFSSFPWYFGCAPAKIWGYVCTIPASTLWIRTRFYRCSHSTAFTHAQNAADTKTELAKVFM